MDTTIYLDYLINRFQKAGGEIKESVRFENSMMSIQSSIS